MVRVVISAEDVWLLANESFDLKNATWEEKSWDMGEEIEVGERREGEVARS